MDDQKQKTISRKAVLPAFLGIVAGAVVLYIIMELLQPKLMDNAAIFSFGDLAAGCMEGSIFYKLMWVLIDFSQGTFMASIPATIFLVIAVLIAGHLEKKNSPLMGSGVDGNHRLLVRMIISALIALLLSQLLFSGFFPDFGGWIPTFGAFLSVQIFVVAFGASPAKLVTNIIVASIVTFFTCLFFLKFVVMPLGLPLFCCIAFGLVAGVPICCELFRLMPWMIKPDAVKKEPAAPKEETAAPAAEAKAPSENRFFFHRVFGDIGELVVWGSSLAVLAMYAGTIISWLMNPLHAGYGVGNLPLMICSQIIVAAISIFIWYPRWKKNGWTFTFASVIFTSAIFITYPNHPLILLLTTIVAVLVFAPLIDWLMKTFNKKGRYPAIFYVQIGVGVVCATWSLLVQHLLLPLVS